MDREIIINFCISNAVIIIIVETLFILLYVGWISKKVFTITKRFNVFMETTQKTARQYNKDLEKADNHSYMIRQNNEKILTDMKKIRNILSKYKGEMFNTQLNNKITDEIAAHLKNDNDDTYTIMEELEIENEHYSLSGPEDNNPFDENNSLKNTINYEQLREEYYKSKEIESNMAKKALENTSSYYNDNITCKIEKPFVEKTVDNVNKYLKLYHKNENSINNINVECHSMKVMDIPKSYKNQEQKVLYKNPLYDKVKEYNQNKLKKGCV